MEIKDYVGIALGIGALFVGYKAYQKFFGSNSNTVEAIAPPTAEKQLQLLDSFNQSLSNFESKFGIETKGQTLFSGISQGLNKFFKHLTTPTQPTSKVLLTVPNQPYSSVNSSYNPNLFGGGLKYINETATANKFYSGLIDNKTIVPKSKTQKSDLEVFPTIKSGSSKTITKAEAPKNNNWSIGASTVPSGKYAGAIYIG